MNTSRSSACSLRTLGAGAPRTGAGAPAALNRGTLALSLSYTAPGSAEHLERAQAARAAFLDALERLDDQEAWVRAGESRRMWHAETRRSYGEADEPVIDLGGWRAHKSLCGERQAPQRRWRDARRIRST